MTGQFSENRVVVRGAGEMASGVIRRLFLAGFEVVALEQAAPSCVRRSVCYAEAVFEREVTIEDVTVVLADSAEAAIKIIARKCIPLLVDPCAESLPILRPLALIDGRMLKKDIEVKANVAPIVVGLGPGFVVGQNCHAAVETNRGFDLGRVYYNGGPQAYTGVPTPIEGKSSERVLRSPAQGILRAWRKIGDTIAAGEIICAVAGRQVESRIGGILRGLIRDGSQVVTDQKIGDVDPRGIKEYCFKISDKANAIAGGVLEAVFALRARLI